MKKTIRQSCFETNSSSMHSISIGAGKLNDTIYLNKDGGIVLMGGEFGWGVDYYNDALTKANYLAVDAHQNEYLVKKLKKIIMEYTGAKFVILDFNTDNGMCYIDHQSCGTGISILNESEDDVKQFLFSKSSRLIIDNDNH